MLRTVRAVATPALAALTALAAAGCTISSTTDRPAAADPGAAGTTPAAAPAAGGAPAPATGAAPRTAPVAPDSLRAAPDSAARPGTTAGALAPTARPVADVRVEVNLATRQLAVFRGRAPAGTYGVAVGSPEWPTRRTVKQTVDLPRVVPTRVY